MKKPQLLFLLLAVVLLSCKKKQNDEGIQETTHLMTIIFDGFIPNQMKAIVFISDGHGRLISEKVCETNGTFVLKAPSGIQVPQRFQVTLVRYELYWHNVLVTIRTFREIQPATWKVTGFLPDTMGHSTFRMMNIPPHNGMFLYSTPGYANYTFSTDPKECLLYDNPSRFFVRFNSDAGGAKYKMVEQVIPGNIYDVNLSDAESLQQSWLSLTSPAIFYESKIWLTGGSNSPGTIPLQVDQGFGDGTTVDQIPLFFPPNPDYRARVSIFDDFTMNPEYIMNQYGSLPDHFTRIEAELEKMSQGVHSVSFEASGKMDILSAEWEFMSTSNHIFQWSVSGPDSVRTFVLPDIPISLTNIFPMLSLDSLEFKCIQANDLFKAESYAEALNSLFNPSAPAWWDVTVSQDVASIRKKYTDW